jgi:hypothetical protein
MRRAWGTYGRNLLQGSLKERDHLKDLGIDGRTTLK